MSSKKWFVSLMSAAALTVSTGALAQATVPNFYIGAEVGQGDNSESDTGFKFFGGYQFHKNIAAEVAYGMLIDKNSVEVTTIEAVAVGIFPLTPNFSILGKLGVANVDFETPNRSEDKSDLTYGVGVQWDFTRNLGVRATWQAYNADPDDVSYISVGAVWRF